MLQFIAKFFDTYLRCKSLRAKSSTYAIPNFTTRQVKQIKCLKKKDDSVTLTSAEYSGAFINLIPAKTVWNYLFLKVSTLFISVNYVFLTV